MKNLNFLEYKHILPFLFITLLFLLPKEVYGQHNWEIPSGFGYNAEVVAVVELDDEEVSRGTLGAFVGEECRGFVDGAYFDPSGKTIFPLVIQSNNTDGEIVQFKYYDDVADRIYTIIETLVFFVDSVSGNAIDPYVFLAKNNAEPIASCPDFSDKLRDVGPHVFDLELIFSDPEGEAITYDAVASDGSLVRNGNQVEFTAASSGVSTLILSASDAEYTVQCDYSFDIDPTNTPPFVDKELVDMVLDEGFGSYEIDLDTVFSDPDMDALSYSAISSETEVLTVSVSGSKLVLSEVGGGNAQIIVEATDGKVDVEDVFNVIVFSDAPVTPWEFSDEYAYKGIIEAELMVNGSAITSGVLGAFVGNECRGSIEGVYFAPNGNTVFSLIIYSNVPSGEFITFRYTHPHTGVVKRIREYVEFKSDMQLGTVFIPYVLDVVSENKLPVIETSFDDVTLDEHFLTEQVSLTGVFSDPEGVALNYSSGINNEAVATSEVLGMNMVIHEVSPGVSLAVVSASDGELIKDEFFTLTINDINDPPELVEPINTLSYDEGFRSVSVDVSGVFEDPEGDEMTYSVSSDDSEVVSVYFTETSVIIREEGFGTATVTVCASDEEFEICHDISVSVIDINNAPEIVCASFLDISMLEIIEDFSIFSVCDSVFDKDGDELSFSVSSSNPLVAGAAMEDCDLKITAQGVGITTIEFCAFDGELSTCCSFEFEVVPENVLSLSYEEKDLGYQDTLKIKADFKEFVVNVQSATEWSFVSYSEWVLMESIDAASLKVSCSENKTGEWRMALVRVMDDQDHEAQFYVFQSESGVEIIDFEDSAGVIVVYPNPVSDRLIIRSENIAYQTLNLHVIDGSGRLIQEKKNVSFGAEGLELDVSLLVEGLYYLRIFDGTGISYELPFVKAGS